MKNSHEILAINESMQNKFYLELLEATVDIYKKVIPVSRRIQNIDCYGKANSLPLPMAITCAKFTNSWALKEQIYIAYIAKLKDYQHHA